MIKLLKCPAMLEAAGEAPSCLEVEVLSGPGYVQDPKPTRWEKAVLSSDSAVLAVLSHGRL